MVQVKYEWIETFLREGHREMMKEPSTNEKLLSESKALAYNSNNNGHKNGRRGKNCSPEELSVVGATFPCYNCHKYGRWGNDHS